MTTSMAAKSQSSVAISATFTAEPLNEFLQFWIERLGLPLRIEHAAFNQVFQTLLDADGLFAGNSKDGVNVILLRWEDLGEDAQHIASNAASLIETIARAGNYSQTPLVVAACPGSPAFLANGECATLATELGIRLEQAISGTPNACFMDACELISLYSVSKIRDDLSDRLGQIPYTGEFFAALATGLARKIAALLRLPYKVIAVDLDNTLWKGVVGEDGVDGIRIEPSHRALQEFLLKQRSEGMLLCICSKNNEADAWEVFERRSEMVLQKAHFTAWRINWDAKSTNLRAMAQELSLGLDSFIFIDDDAKECTEIQENIPEALTLRLPEAAGDVLKYLKHLWAFDRLKVTTEDRKRSGSYEQERARRAATQNATSLQDFINALDLAVTIEPLHPEGLARVAQLTQRTNQFNTTTVRRTEAEIKSLLDAGKLECITVTVKDRFGDYGMVGAVFYSFETSALVAESMMLSCRVLGRGVEHQVVRYLGQQAKLHKIPNVLIQFIASPKNTPAYQFLDGINSQCLSGTAFVMGFQLSTESALLLNHKPSQHSAAIEPDKKAETHTTATLSIDDAEIALRFNTADAVQKAVRETIPLSEVQSGDFTGPRNQTESTLAEIWSQVLQVAPIGVHDDFFELGGDSLRAVELVVRISEKFDVPDLTLTAVLDAPTVAQFSAVLGKSREVRCLVALRETGSRPPIFFVPGGGGNVLSFRRLAMSIPSDQPFWALQAPGLDGSGTVDDAKKIASMYIDEIRTVQRHGPYLIGGASYGGIIAFEMAQQLIAQGEEIALLVLLDSYNLAFGKMIPRSKAIYCHTRFFVQRAAASLVELSKTPIKNWPRHFSRDTATSVRIAKRVLKMFVSEPPNQKQIRPQGLEQTGGNPNEVVDVLERVLEANMRAVERYVPEPYLHPITLFRASVRMVEPYQDEYLGWGPVAHGGIVLEIVPGRHSDFDKAALGKALDRHLKIAQDRVASQLEPVST